jgi:hypothetical protein
VLGGVRPPGTYSWLKTQAGIPWSEMERWSWKPTRSQRVSVLRAMRRIIPDAPRAPGGENQAMGIASMVRGKTGRAKPVEVKGPRQDELPRGWHTSITSGKVHAPRAVTFGFLPPKDLPKSKQHARLRT